MSVTVVGDIQKAVAEARADEARKCAADVCEMCKAGGNWHPARRIPDGEWLHAWAKGGASSHERCRAQRIHERLSLKGGEGKG